MKHQARETAEGLTLLRRQTMAIMGWDPNELRWDLLKKLGVDL